MQKSWEKILQGRKYVYDYSLWGKIASHNKYLKWIIELNKNFKDIIEKERYR